MFILITTPPPQPNFVPSKDRDTSLQRGAVDDGEVAATQIHLAEAQNRLRSIRSEQETTVDNKGEVQRRQKDPTAAEGEVAEAQANYDRAVKTYEAEQAQQLGRETARDSTTNKAQQNGTGRVEVEEETRDPSRNS